MAETAAGHRGATPTSVALAWSGGKDSTLSLATLRRDDRYDVRALLTTLTEGYDRVSMHGVRRELLEAQADALGLPLVPMWIPRLCTNEVYEARMREALSAAELRDVDTVAFGDLFLQDIRQYREERLREAGKQGLFPLWGRDTAEMAREFIGAGFRAILVCIDPRALDASFAGRLFDEELLNDLPAGVDPCGENGEFHTYVFDSPIFSTPIAISVGETVSRDEFVFCDLLPG